MSIQQTELFDLYNSYNQALNQQKARYLVHQDGDWHRSVHIWIPTSKSSFILQKRSKFKDTNPGLWDISSAGHLDEGESAMQAALRELQEETGLSVSKNELQFCFVRKNEFIQEQENICDREFQSVYLLLKNVSLGDLHLEESEVDDFQIFSESEIFQMMKTGKMVEHIEEFSNLMNVMSSEE